VKEGSERLEGDREWNWREVNLRVNQERESESEREPSS